MDKYILNFISENTLTLLFIYTLFMGIAKVSPWKWDEKIMQVIAEAFNVFRFKKED